MKKSANVPVECQKLFTVPDGFTYNHLYGKEGRYLLDHARQMGIRMELNQLNHTIKISGVGYHGVAEFSEFLRLYIASCTRNDLKNIRLRDKGMFYVANSLDKQFVFEKCTMVHQSFLTQLPYTPYALKAFKSPLSSSVSSTNSARMVGKCIDNAENVEAIAKALEMMFFSDTFQDEPDYNLNLEILFLVGKELFFKPKGSSYVSELFRSEKSEIISIDQLRTAVEGLRNDFRQMFYQYVDIRISEVIRDRLLENGFSTVGTAQLLKLRLRDLSDGTFIDAEYKLEQSSEGTSCRLISMFPSFQKHHSITMISVLNQSLPDYRVELRNIDYYGPNHPSSIYAWAFAKEIKWDEDNGKVVVKNDIPWRRFEINMWERVTRQTFENENGSLRLFICDINEDTGIYKCAISGCPVKLQEKLEFGEKLTHNDLMELFKSLNLLLSPF